MAPYLETVKSFSDVEQSDAGVDTRGFLAASEGVVGIFDLLDSSALGLVSKDLTGNIAKVRARYEADPSKSQTLELLVQNEMSEKKSTATQGLLWLTRGLSFTCKALQEAQANKQKELTEAFGVSYEKTLKPYHSFVVRPVFALAMKACPSRSLLYSKLSEDKEGGASASADTLDTKLNGWLMSLDQIITRIDKFYDAHNYKKGL